MTLGDDQSRRSLLSQPETMDAKTRPAAATGQLTTVVLHVGEQYCGSEKLVVEKAVGDRSGVIGMEANPAAQTATVTYDPSLTSVEQLRDWVRGAGFDCAGCSCPTCTCDPLREVDGPPAPDGEHAVERAQQAHGEGGHAGHSMTRMAEQMRNRFFVSLVFTLAILAWSALGKSIFGQPLAVPFGLDRNVWELFLSLPVLYAARMFLGAALVEGR